MFQEGFVCVCEKKRRNNNGIFACGVLVGLVYISRERLNFGRYSVMEKGGENVIHERVVVLLKPIPLNEMFG